MPMYSFEAVDEEPHWEIDLLEDDREQQIALNVLTIKIIQLKIYRIMKVYK